MRGSMGGDLRYWRSRWPVELVVAEVLGLVESRRASLREVMEEYFRRRPFLAPISRLVRAYALAVLRTYRLLDRSLECVLGVDPHGLSPLERNLLRAVVYEVMYRDVPLDRALEAAAKLKTVRLGSDDLNALKAVTEDELLKGLGGYERLAVRYSVPTWVVRYLGTVMGDEEVPAFLRAINSRAATWVRVNLLRTSLDELRRALARRGVIVVPDKDLKDVAEVVRQDTSLVSTPEYRAGLLYLQDKASALVAHILGPEPGQRIVDLCAAPGGKLGHIYQLSGGGATVVGLEWRRDRSATMSLLMRRMGYQVHMAVADSRVPPLRARFDKVLVDPDCSSLGRLGHSPEIRLWVTPETVSRFVRDQKLLLKAASALVRRGGEVVYSTCTLTLEENEENTRWASRNLGLEPVDATPRIGLPGVGLSEAQRLYPHTHRTQGFYVVKFIRE